MASLRNNNNAISTSPSSAVNRPFRMTIPTIPPRNAFNGGDGVVVGGGPTPTAEKENYSIGIPPQAAVSEKKHNSFVIMGASPIHEGVLRSASPVRVLSNNQGLMMTTITTTVNQQAGTKELPSPSPYHFPLTHRRTTRGPRLTLPSPAVSSGNKEVSFQPGPGSDHNHYGHGDAPLSSSSIRGQQNKRVLRYGETMESLFRLDSKSAPEYWEVCRSIVDGIAADDASAWRRALEYARRQAAEQQEYPSTPSDQLGSDLLRLHRRATSRFEHVPDGQANDVLNLWLSYAKAQVLYGSERDARLTFRLIQNQGIGEQEADLYLALADLERQAGNQTQAVRVLQTGIQKQAQPLDSLQTALKGLASEPLEHYPMAGGERNESPTKLLPGKSKIQEPPPAKRRKVMNTAVETVNRIEDRGKDMVLLTTAGRPQPASRDNSKDSIRFQLAPAVTASAAIVVESQQMTTDPVPNLTADVKKDDSTITARPDTVTANPSQISSLLSANRSSSRPPLLSKSTPGRRAMGTTGRLGRPERVDPSKSAAFDSDEDADQNADANYMDQASDCNLSVTKTDDRRAPSRKPVKMDLSYMWAWDPNKPRVVAAGAANDSSSEQDNEGQHETNDNNADPKIRSTGKGSVPPGSGEASTGLIRKEEEGVAASAQAHSTPPLNNLNPDFLPLVSEGNILRVNGMPFAKLGVIGRGGSCKVYRVLSRQCHVLAIKKVKLNGKDPKTIDGYSNEISLLRRLRGNPSIIQMYDSELDMERKAIFLLMELGEVDLNHVLQHQALASGPSLKSPERHLNLNFIRLTWQQMLTAVHSIHEERIIHGDLKPANFLFVRGTLKLIDFGIAKAIQSDDTTSIYRESQIGTLNYMSPEAILDTGSSSNGTRLKIGRASDIWSLGCILYQMVYGMTPFAELHMIQKLHAIVNPSHTIAFPKADEDAVDAMRRCLRRQPEERPPIVGVGGLLTEHRFLNSSQVNQKE